DAGARGGVVGEPGELVGARARVGGHRDGAEPGASEPGEYRLGTIVEMHEDPVPGLHAAGVQARGEARDTIPELAIGPRPARSVEGTPDQVGMAGPQAGLRLDETADVLAGERLERCGSDPAH